VAAARERPPRVVCVTGMHRSGTSLATRALDLLGASLGDPDLLLHPGKDNPTGYWENRLIKELDDEILAELGGSWDRPPVLQPGWETDVALDPLRERASDVLETTFGPEDARTGVLVWKDPRSSLLLPFWQSVVAVAATVLVVRHPGEVAKSLERRNGFSVAESAALWLRYVLAACAVRPEPKVIRSHDLFDDDRRPRTLDELADHVGLPAPDDRARQRVAVELDPSLRHHRVESDPAYQDPVSSLADSVWNGGELRPEALSEPVRAALGQGWLRAPGDTAELDQARAKVVKLQETLRRRARQQAEAKARREEKAAARRAERERRLADSDPPPERDR
jgi:hypothetical protein